MNKRFRICGIHFHVYVSLLSPGDANEKGVLAMQWPYLSAVRTLVVMMMWEGVPISNISLGRSKKNNIARENR